MEVPVSAVNLPCQSRPCRSNATEVTITTTDRTDGATAQVEGYISYLQVSLFSFPLLLLLLLPLFLPAMLLLSLGQTHQGSARVLIYVIDLPPRND